jgi:hypothetical protein
VWNTEGFHIVSVLPRGARFDINSYSENILSEIFRACPVRSNRQLVVHAVSASAHASKWTKEFMEENYLR